MKSLLIAASLFAATHIALSGNLSLIPWPAGVQPLTGQFIVTGHTVVTADAAFTREAALIADEFRLKIAKTAADNSIQFTTRGAEGLGEEAYRIEVKPKGITVCANTPAGAFYASQTLRQLRDPDLHAIPCVKIEDAPRFAWRGFMLDISRHFFDKDTILRVIDRMASHKLNRFHIHLTDDQGWRLEIERYPELTEIGARGNFSDKNAPPRFFTKSEMQEIVRYAEQRHITIVPEIDMPGHARAAARCFPNLSSGANTLNPASDATYDFLQNVLAEVMGIFPSPWIHIGGDEVNTSGWRNDAAVAQKMKAEGFNDPNQIKKYFTRRISNFIGEHGRTPAVWHEALAADPDKNTIIFLWRAYPGTLRKALDTGHPVVLAPSVPFYFSASIQGTDGSRTLRNSVEDVYRGTTLLSNVPAAQMKQILGVQACVWTERIPTAQQLEITIMPRMLALAETAWTPMDRQDYVDFARRLAAYHER